MTAQEIKAYLSELGKKGGAAGTGKDKRRGNKAYYRALSKKAVAARAKKRKKAK